MSYRKAKQNLSGPLPPADYRRLIRHHAEISHKFLGHVRQAGLSQERGNGHRQKGSAACRQRMRHYDRIYDCIHRAVRATNYSGDRNLLEFVICFLEEDPRFLRSGYIKELLLTKVKRSALMGSDRSRLQAVLLDAVHCRGGREFKRYCRLAAKISDPVLVAALEEVAEAGDRRQISRANLMLSYTVQR